MKQKVITLIIILIIILVIILVIKWNLGFPWFFFAVWPGGRRCANCRDVHFFERYCDESIFTWKTFKTTMEKKKKKQKKQKVQTHGQGLGRGLAGDMGLNFLFFGFSMVFCSLTKTSRTQKKKKNKKFRPMGKVWAIHTQTKTKKPKNQKTKKPKNQKTKKTKIAHPKGRGSDAECWVLSFWFFGFLVFWFFGFLVFFFWFFFLVFWFFGFLVFWFFGLCVDSHCRCAKQRLPGTVSGCTRSKVDTLQYSNVCYDIVHSANEQQRGVEFNFVRLRHMLLDLCTGNAAICALPQWPNLKKNSCQQLPLCSSYDLQVEVPPKPSLFCRIVHYKPSSY